MVLTLLAILLAVLLESQAQLQLGGVRPGPVQVLNQPFPNPGAPHDNLNLWGQCVCVLGRFAVLTGGRVVASAAGSASSVINVFNLDTEVWVTGTQPTTLGRRHGHACAVVTVGNTSTCVVVGGEDEAGDATAASPVAAANGNLVTKFLTVSDAGVVSVADGPSTFVASTAAIRHLTCAGVGSVVYCLGGEGKADVTAATVWFPRKQSFWLDRSLASPVWNLGAVPTTTATGVYFPHRTPAVVDASNRVWFCGAILYTDTADPATIVAGELAPSGVCWVWDTTNSTYNASTASLPAVTLGTARLRPFVGATRGPNPVVAVLGGEGAAPADITTWDATVGANPTVLTTNQLALGSANLTFSQQSFTAAADLPLYTQATTAIERHWVYATGGASVYTSVVFFGGANCQEATCAGAGSQQYSSLATVLDLYNPAAPTRYLLGPLSEEFRFPTVATYQNKAFLLAGRRVDDGGANDRFYVHVVKFSCTGSSAAGDDTWHAATGTCRVQECNDNYYGPSCTACNCTATGNVTTGVCDGGLTGTGACTCNTGYYGTACHSGNGAVCTGNGVIDPSVNSTGSCTCFPGFWDADCSGTCDTCTNGVCNDGATGDGVCECLPGFYGDACTACDCGTGACHAGLTGTGECVCEPGTWGANCQGVCGVPTEEATEFDAEGCPPVALDEEFVLTFRCDDGAAGTGHCVPLYSSAVVSVQSLVILLLSCLALLY